MASRSIVTGTLASLDISNGISPRVEMHSGKTMMTTHTPNVGPRELLEVFVCGKETTLLVIQREACLPVLQWLGNCGRGGGGRCRR